MERKPRSSDWVLRFKMHKTTVLLFVDPNDTWTRIKGDLYKVLRSRKEYDVNGKSIPDDPNDILIGVPRERADLSQGFVPLETTLRPVADAKDKREGTPAWSGLKDGAVLAFKFRKDADGITDEDEGMDMDEEWDVVLPSYDEDSQSQT